MFKDPGANIESIDPNVLSFLEKKLQLFIKFNPR